MYKAWLVIIASALISFAGVDVRINVGIPVVPIVMASPQEFEAEPDIVIVSPGLYVVQDSPEEIFFSAGFYWTIRGGTWYQCRGRHSRWVCVHRNHVPPTVLRTPPGRYKNWHHENGHHDNGYHGHGKH